MTETFTTFSNGKEYDPEDFLDFYYINPALNETTGGTISYAYSATTPIISTNGISAWDNFQNGSGLLLNPALRSSSGNFTTATFTTGGVQYRYIVLNLSIFAGSAGSLSLSVKTGGTGGSLLNLTSGGVTTNGWTRGTISSTKIFVTNPTTPTVGHEVAWWLIDLGSNAFDTVIVDFPNVESISMQSLVVSLDGAQPGNCFGSFTKIMCESGDYKAIKKIEDGSSIAIFDENGKKEVVTAKIFYQQNQQLETLFEISENAIAQGIPSKSLFFSKDHLVFFPVEYTQRIIKSAGEWWCKDCAKTGKYGGITDCHRCNPIKMNGYKGIIVRDLNFSIVKIYQKFAPRWYQISLPTDKINYAVQVDDKIFAECYRTPFDVGQKNNNFTLNKPCE
jgi:hypothetical protein